MFPLFRLPFSRSCSPGLIVFWLWSACSGASAVTVSISTPPPSVHPGQTIDVSVTFSKPAAAGEKRLVFLLELRRLEDDGLVTRAVDENGGGGYTTSSGTIPFSLTVPPGTTGSLYLSAWATPWSLNQAIVEHYKTYPTDGTFTYLWEGGGYGVTRDVRYLGSLICPKPAGNTTYCSGLAFETFVISCNDYNTTYGHSRIGTLSTSGMETFRRVWYGVTDAEKLAARAIPEYGLGLEITDLEEAQEGDFIQFWRHSGSGHNPVFVNWVRDQAGDITGVRYWGSQSSSNGIGYRTESFGLSSGINRPRFYIGRLKKPRDQADYDWALGSATTRSQPTVVPASGVADWADY